MPQNVDSVSPCRTVVTDGGLDVRGHVRGLLKDRDDVQLLELGVLAQRAVHARHVHRMMLAASKGSLNKAMT